ncbi:MAG: energy transducer TonB [Candidatus Sulfotelmatobacter sp.]
MTRIATVSCLLALRIAMAAQSEPSLIAVAMPMYPPLARQARIAGVVKLTFALTGDADEPTNVEVISGHPMLKDAAIENVKTWRFNNSYACGTYRTTFRYRFSDVEGTHTVTFHSFHQVDIVTDAPAWEPSGKH